MPPDALDTNYDVHKTPVVPNLSDEEAKLIYKTLDDEMCHRIKLYKSTLSKTYFNKLQEQQPVL